MSILIDNNLIWVSIPRCASLSIEKTIMNINELNSIHYLDYNNLIIHDVLHSHGHFMLNSLYQVFGRKETICITRDWFDRWLSSLEQIFKIIKMDNLTPIIDWIDVDNNFIYDTFDSKFSNDIYSGDSSLECYYKLIKKDNNISNNLNGVINILRSQNFWKNNEKCTYEFDIHEIYKFENFMSNRYNVDFRLPTINASSGIKSKIVIDDKLKNHVWNIFESIFVRKNLI